MLKENRPPSASSAGTEGRALRIAVMGTRGIPANYGGFETFAQELSTRLAVSGHQVTVYCRKHYAVPGLRLFQGVRLITLPALRHKYFDTVSHTFLSMLHSLGSRYDIILACNAANAVFCFLPRLLGTRVILNVDGLEKNRKKWNVIGRAWYRLSERLSCFMPTAVVTDAEHIRQYYQTRYRKESVMIPYGAQPVVAPPGETLAALGLKPGEYYLYVSRLEPENNAHLVIRLFAGLRTGKRLVILGDAPYSREYIASLKATPDPRVLFPGAIYGDGYRELVSNAFCYIHATEVGGTHPALVENMAVGNVIFSLDTPENREVVGDAGILFRSSDLDEALRLLQQVEDRAEAHAELKEKAERRARDRYSWESVVESYVKLFRAALGTTPPK